MHPLRAMAWLTALAAPAAGQGAGGDAVFRCLPEISTVAYRVEHPFNTVHGRSNAISCRVGVDPDTADIRISASVPVRSFDSGNDLRDSHAMDAVEADRFPTVEFTSTRVEVPRQGVAEFGVTGELTFHGVTRTIRTVVTPGKRGDTVRATGSFAIRLTDFRVERPSLLFIPVRDEARISFDLALSTSASRNDLAGPPN